MQSHNPTDLSPSEALLHPELPYQPQLKEEPSPPPAPLCSAPTAHPLGACSVAGPSCPSPRQWPAIRGSRLPVPTVEPWSVVSPHWGASPATSLSLTSIRKLFPPGSKVSCFETTEPHAQPPHGPAPPIGQPQTGSAPSWGSPLALPEHWALQTALTNWSALAVDIDQPQTLQTPTAAHGSESPTTTETCQQPCPTAELLQVWGPAEGTNMIMWQFQHSFTLEVCLGCHKTSRSLHQPARTLKVYKI